jgi:hypothetical protein
MKLAPSLPVDLLLLLYIFIIGTSAAVLMASLRACLRTMTTLKAADPVKESRLWELLRLPIG